VGTRGTRAIARARARARVARHRDGRGLPRRTHGRRRLAVGGGADRTLRAVRAELVSAVRGPLDHGYAPHLPKAQGATVDVATLDGAGTLAREAGYVGLSRCRTNHLYSPADNPAVWVDNDVYLAQLVADLGTCRAHIMATRQLPTTGDSDRSSIRPEARQIGEMSA
jgi:hypothetical protein